MLLVHVRKLLQTAITLASYGDAPGLEGYSHAKTKNLSQFQTSH